MQHQGWKRGVPPRVIPSQGLVLSTLLSRLARGNPHLLAGASLHRDRGDAAPCPGHPEPVAS